MKKLFLLVIVLIISCSENEEFKIDEVESTPPSLENSEKQISLINISDKQLTELNLKYLKIIPAIEKFSVIAPGTVVPAPDEYSIISAPISGRILKIYAHEGEYVKKGQILAELQSLEFANLISAYIRANAQTDYLKQQVDRLEKLTEKKISPEAELEKFKSEYRKSVAEKRAAYSNLKSTGLSEAEINTFINSDKDEVVFKIKSPINGKINDHLIEHGQSVQMYDKMMDIINETKVLIKTYLAPNDAQLINPGDSVKSITQKDNSNKRISAVVKSVNPALDIENKSVIANVYAHTKNGWPKPGENVRIKIQVKTNKPVISIPMDAIVYEGNQAVIFVKKDNNTFEKRQIVLSRTTEEKAFVVEGLSENDEVVINQLFSLKALSKFNEFAD